MNSYKKLRDNSFLFAIGTLGSKLINFILVPVYAYYLTTADYGTVDLVITTVSMFTPLLTLGIYEGVLRYSVEKHANKKTVFSSAISILIVSYSIALFFYPIAVRFNVFGEYLLLFYIVLFLQSFQITLQQFVRGIGRVKIFVINGLLITFLTAILNILFLVILKLDVYGYLLATILALLTSIIFLFYSANLRKLLSYNNINLKMTKKLLSYSLPLVPNSISYRLTNSSSRYFILYFLDTSSNGLFAVSSKIPLVINVISQVFTQAWQLSAFEEYDNENISEFYSTVFSYLSTVLFLATNLMFIIIKPIFYYLFSIEYFEAWKPVPFLILGAVFSSFSSFFGTNYSASKDTKGVFKTTVISGMISIITNIILIPLIGLVGAGISSAVSFFILFIIRYYDTKKYFIVNINWKNFIISVVLISFQIIILYANLSFNVELSILMFLFIINLILNKDTLKVIGNLIFS